MSSSNVSSFRPEVFKTSRQMDFFSEAELTTQTGHEIDEWPLVILKEAIDNALDACEEHDTAPVIRVHASDTGIAVSDNGPGIPESTIEGVLDFNVRASSREAYVTPTRGRQGNALMTLAGMPFVLAGAGGALVIESGGQHRRIRVQANALTQTPEIVVERSESKLRDESENDESYKTDGEAQIESKLRDESENLKTYKTDGTTIGITWPTWPFDADPTETGGCSWSRELQDCAFDLLRGYALFNPHLTLIVNWFGREEVYEATDTEFKKWRPSQPSSCHWYTVEQFNRLIGAYIAHDRGQGITRTVSEFLTVFDSLKGTSKRKKILEATGLSRVNLSELATADELDESRISELLAAMQEATKPVKPPRLGMLGKSHVTSRLTEWGCEPGSIRYVKQADFDDEGLPVVIEVVFGVLAESLTDISAQIRRQMITGANFSAAIKNPFREFGATGQGLEGALTDARANWQQPVIYAAHLARPSVSYTDRGKSAIALS